MKKIVGETLNEYKNFNSLNEISDAELQKKIEKAKEEGRKISPEYEKTLWAKQSQNKEAGNEREKKKKQEETHKAYVKREEVAKELEPILQNKFWRMDGKEVFFRKITPRDIGLIFTINSHDKDINQMGYLLYKDVEDELILYNATGSKDSDIVSIQKISEAFGMLTQIFKKYYPESKYVDRKIWSGLS